MLVTDAVSQTWWPLFDFCDSIKRSKRLLNGFLDDTYQNDEKHCFCFNCRSSLSRPDSRLKTLYILRGPPQKTANLALKAILHPFFFSEVRIATKYRKSLEPTLSPITILIFQRFYFLFNKKCDFFFIRL